jgi:hypothetical protein
MEGFFHGPTSVRIHRGEKYSVRKALPESFADLSQGIHTLCARGGPLFSQQSGIEPGKNRDTRVEESQTAESGGSNDVWQSNHLLWQISEFERVLDDFLHVW